MAAVPRDMLQLANHTNDSPLLARSAAQCSSPSIKRRCQISKLIKRPQPLRMVLARLMPRGQLAHELGVEDAALGARSPEHVFVDDVAERPAQPRADRHRETPSSCVSESLSASGPRIAWRRMYFVVKPRSFILTGSPAANSTSL